MADRTAMVEQLVDAAMSVLSHDTDSNDLDENGAASGKYLADQLRMKFTAILGKKDRASHG